MAHIVVLGAGLVGLSTALLLARDGHRVTVLERNGSRPPKDPAAAWTTWDRPGVKQFRQLHVMLPRWHREMSRELPDVVDRLAAAGGRRVNVLHLLPPARTGGWRPGDDRFETVTARRPMLEAVLAAAAGRDHRITVHRGMAVTGLLIDEPTAGVPRVTGVRTGPSRWPADLVVDATGLLTGAHPGDDGVVVVDDVLGVEKAPPGGAGRGLGGHGDGVVVGMTVNLLRFRRSRPGRISRRRWPGCGRTRRSAR